jgi:hypothetical protein
MQVVDKTADMGNLGKFEDSSGIEALSAATYTLLMITTNKVSYVLV